MFFIARPQLFYCTMAENAPKRSLTTLTVCWALEANLSEESEGNVTDNSTVAAWLRLSPLGKLYRARYFRNIKVSTIAASIPLHNST